MTDDADRTDASPGAVDAGARGDDAGPDVLVDASPAVDAIAPGFCASRQALTVCDDFEGSDGGGAPFVGWTLFGNASLTTAVFRSPSTSMRSSTLPVDGGNPNGEIYREDIPLTQGAIVDFGFDIRPDTPPNTVSGLGYMQMNGEDSTRSSAVSFGYAAGSLVVEVADFNPPDLPRRQSYLSQAALPVGVWSRVDLTVKLSRTAGEVTLAVEGRKTQLTAVTISTAPVGVNRLRLGVGLIPAAGTGTAHYDNVTLGIR